MHALDILGDPVRRRLVELLAQGEKTAGELTDAARAEFGISQPAVSNHLRVLRDAGFARSLPDGSRRIYALRADGLVEIGEWIDRYRRFWAGHLDDLEAHLHRRARESR